MVTNKKKKNVIIIFAKKPEIGRVKTRIAEETSSKFAFELASTCFLDLLHKLKNSDFYDLIVGVDSYDDLSWFQQNFSLDGIVVKSKKGKNKQEIQSNKFEEIFYNLLSNNGYYYKKAILIPMDIPFISEEDLITAFSRLDQKKCVHGPEINGGVYLIGIRGPYKKGIFKGVRWSTSASFDDLVRNCGKNDTFILKLKNDINLSVDIIKLRQEIRHSCPLLYEFLQKNGYYLPINNRYINFDDLSISIPVVSNVVQRKTKNGIKILVQTRYKPSVDPKNTGKLEIPSGLIKRYELAQDAAIRETVEETGIISEISKEQKVNNYLRYDGEYIIAAYKPFFCCQQLRGDRAYLMVAFVSNYVSGELKENIYENRNPRWLDLGELKKYVLNKPTEVFGMSLSILREYLLIIHT